MPDRQCVSLGSGLLTCRPPFDRSHCSARPRERTDHRKVLEPVAPLDDIEPVRPPREPGVTIRPADRDSPLPLLRFLQRDAVSPPVYTFQ